MSEASIPVDLFNPGQVFACLGFLEAADILLGDAEGRFDWSEAGGTQFWIRNQFDDNPFGTVLEKLANTKLSEIYPKGWPDDQMQQQSLFPSPLSEHFNKEKSTTTKLPGLLELQGQSVFLGSWTDSSSRPVFKLYSGNRSGCSIASDMLFGKRGKPKKSEPLGEILNQGVQQIVNSNWDAVVRDPLNVTVSMAGSFNMDPRGAWNAMDAGYSPDKHHHAVAASPVVEFFACFSLEHFRPFPKEKGKYEYAAWQKYLPPSLARVACSGVRTPFTARHFTFAQALSGKNKLITFANETTR